MSISKFMQKINQLRIVTGSLRKISKLKDFDNQEFILLKNIYDPYISYNCSSSVLKDISGDSDNLPRGDVSDINKCIHDIITEGTFTRDKAIYLANRFGKDVISLVLDRDIRAGVSVKSINRVSTYPIPTFDLAKAFTAVTKKEKTNQIEFKDILSEDYVIQKKYDGNRLIIKVDRNNIKFYTSRGHSIRLTALYNEMSLFNLKLGIYDCEFVGKGSPGKLGDRSYSSLMPYKKALTDRSHIVSDNYTVYVHQYIDIVGVYTNEDSAEYIEKFNKYDTKIFKVADRYYGNYEEVTRTLLKEGWEGTVLKLKRAKYIRKRDRTWIKVKNLGNLKEADLLCVGYELGTQGKKYSNSIGALILVDSKGIKVKVSLGLSDHDRQLINMSLYKNKVLTINYESFDKTYIQPKFPRDFIRSDKDTKDIE